MNYNFKVYLHPLTRTSADKIQVSVRSVIVMVQVYFLLNVDVYSVVSRPAACVFIAFRCFLNEHWGPVVVPKWPNVIGFI